MVEEEEMRTKPMRTIELLNDLVKFGFDDSAFSLLHHKPKETIQGHSSYCGQVTRFQCGDENARVQHRLEIVHGAYKGGQFTSRSPLFFQHLALLARVEVPMEH